MSDDWITVDILNAMLHEVDEHPSRVRYIDNVRRGILHYSATYEWYVPNSEFEDVNISDDNPTCRENHIRKTVDEVGSVLLKNDPVVRTHPHRAENAALSNDMDEILLAAWRAARTQTTLRTE